MIFMTQGKKNADLSKQASRMDNRNTWGGRWMDSKKDMRKPRSYFKYTKKIYKPKNKNKKWTYYYDLKTRKKWKTYGRKY